MTEAELRIAIIVMARDAEAQIAGLSAQVAAFDKQLNGMAAKSKSSGFSSIFQQISQAEGFANKLKAAGTGIGTALSSIGGALNKMESAGKSLQWAGRQVEQNFTLPILAAAAIATVFAFKNEAAFTQLRRVYTLAGSSASHLSSDLSLLQRSFMALSDIYGVQVADVTNIGVAWAQAGARGGDLVVAVRSTLDAMALSGMSYQDASTGLIALRQQWGLTIKQLAAGIDVINMVADNSAVSFADLFASIRTGGPIAAAAGLDLQHYTALVAAMVPASGSASAAGNSLKTIFTRLFAPTKTAAEVLKLVGNTIHENLLNPADTGAQKLEKLAKGFVGLTAAQQIFVGNAIGTRFQVSRLDVLLKDIANSTGTYNTLLGKTNDAQANAARSARDIALYLSSTPQAFKIATTEIQNALAKAIVPMLPAILGVAKQIAALVTSFTRLKPSTQQFILWLLAVVAISGPLFRVLGATNVLLSLVGKTALGAAGSVVNLVRGFTGLAATKDVPMAKFFAEIGSGARTALGGIAALVRNAGSLMLDGFTLIGRGLIGIFEALEPVFGALGSFIATAWSAGFALIERLMVIIQTALVQAWAALEPVFAFLGAAMAAIFSAAFAIVTPLLAALGTAAGAALGIAIPAGAAVGIGALIVIAGVLAAALVFHFHTQIVDGFKAIGKFIVDVFVAAIKGIAHVFAALPGLVADVLTAVLRTIIAFGKAIWQALSDALNPWQRHSPSLVDLVESGVDVIAAKYKSLSSIGVDLRSAIADLREFGAATKILSDRAFMDNLNAKGLKVIAADPSAAPLVREIIGSIVTLTADEDRLTAAYGRQITVVGNWKTKLDAANASLDVQQTKLDKLKTTSDALSLKLQNAQTSLTHWANAPLVGMRKMEDAIFDNDQKTKGFQLQLLRLQDTFGTLDQLKAKVSSINGDIDLLSGQRAGLQLNGAGSDVLGPYNQAIAGLRKQSNGIIDVVNQMTNLQTQIDKSTQAGQELQLQNDLTFGKMQHEISDVTTAMKEMPFADVIAHVKTQRKSVDELTTSYDKANKKTQAQQAIVDGLTRARDQLQKRYDTENAKLALLGSAYDAIDQQINAAKSALDSMASAATKAGDATAAAFNAAGAGTFPTPSSKGIGPSQTDLNALTKQLENEVNKSFKKVDFVAAFEGPFKRAWAAVKAWWEKNVSIKGLITATLDASGRESYLRWDIWGFVRDAWDHFTSWWSSTVSPFFEHLLEHIGFKPVHYDAFGFLKSSWHTLQDWWDNTAMPFVKGIPDAIVDWFKKLPGRIVQNLKDLGNFIIAPFKWAYEKLVGHSIVPDTVNQIVHWFAGLPGKIVLAIGDLGKKLAKWAQDGADWLFSHIGDAFAGVMTWFSNLPGNIMTTITHALDLGKSFVGWVLNAARNLLFSFGDTWRGVFDWFGTLGTTIASKVGDLSQTLFNSGKQLLGGFFNGVKSVLKNVGGVALSAIPIVGPGLSSLASHLPFAEGGIVQPRPGGIHATIGEAGRAEAVMPLPDGFSMARIVGVMDRMEKQYGGTKQQGGPTPAPFHGQQPTVVHKTFNFHGDLSFPNITDGDDAKTFVRNLEALVD